MPDGIDRIVYLCVGMIVLGGAGLWGAWYLRKKLMSSADEQKPAGGFSLDELRRLRDMGKMSAEEYERTAAMISKLQAAQFMAATPKVPKPPDKRGRAKLGQ